MRELWFVALACLCLSCKKKEREGEFTGEENLRIESSSDTIVSTFNQAVSVTFEANGRCNYSSSTVNYIFDRSDKVKTGYEFINGDFSFQLLYVEDSLYATYSNLIQEELVLRSFKGKKN